MNEPLKSLWEDAVARYEAAINKNLSATILSSYPIGSFSEDDPFTHKCAYFGDTAWNFPENFTFSFEEKILWLAILNSLYS